MRIHGWLFAIGLLLHAGVSAGEIAATVVFASGSPTVIGADGVSRSLGRGGELASGETIDTADGRVQLRFRDGASMSLLPATRFRVDDYRFTGEAGRAGADDKGVFALLKGGLRTITGLIGKGRRDQYRVETVVATIGIRGTEYGANLADDGLRLTTFAGLVEVCNQSGCQLVRPGETALADSPDSKPRLLVDSGSPLPGAGDAPPQSPLPSTQQELPAGGNSPLTPPNAPPRSTTAPPPPNTYNYSPPR